MADSQFTILQFMHFQCQVQILRAVSSRGDFKRDMCQPRTCTTNNHRFMMLQSRKSVLIPLSIAPMNTYVNLRVVGIDCTPF